MFRCYLVILSLLGGAISSKLSPNSLSVLTNIADTELLEFYSSWPNKITDIALEGIRDYLTKNNDTQISIPEVDAKLSETILGVDFSVEFSARNGYFRNPATIVRKGNSSMTFNVLQSNLTSIIGFTEMEVYFPKYEASVIGIKESGDVLVVVGRNQIFFEATITLLPKCTVSLDTIKMTQMDDVTPYITGLGFLDGLADDITARVLTSYESSFTGLVENIIANKLMDVLAKTGGFCKYKKPLVARPLPKPRRFSCSKAEKTRYSCQNV